LHITIHTIMPEKRTTRASLDTSYGHLQPQALDLERAVV
jgi:hypothetical protein